MTDEIMESEELVCIHCGCTEDAACEGGCGWILHEPAVCSACIDKHTWSPEDLKVMGQQLHEMATECSYAALQLRHLDEKLQAAINLLVILVQRQGGSVRIQKSELAALDSNLRLDSYTDAPSDTHILEVNRIDPKTGKRASSLILPGRLPIIGL